MALARICDDTFIDLDRLSLALFTDLDSNPKALVRFSSGDEYQITGTSASALHSFLNQQPPMEPGEMLSAPGLGIVADSGTVDDQLSPSVFPSFARNKAWFYKADEETGRRFFMALVNQKGSCSLRMFDAQSGIAIPKQYRTGNYQDQFKKFIRGAAELTVQTQPNLER